MLIVEAVVDLEVRDGRKEEGEEDIHVYSIDFITCENFAKSA